MICPSLIACREGVFYFTIKLSFLREELTALKFTVIINCNVVGFRAIVSLYVSLFYCYSLLSLFIFLEYVWEFYFDSCIGVCNDYCWLTTWQTLKSLERLPLCMPTGSYLDFPNWRGKTHVLWMASFPNWEPALYEWRETIEHIHVLVALERWYAHAQLLLATMMHLELWAKYTLLHQSCFAQSIFSLHQEKKLRLLYFRFCICKVFVLTIDHW